MVDFKRVVAVVGEGLTQFVLLDELLQTELCPGIELGDLEPPSLVLEQDDNVAVVAGPWLGPRTPVRLLMLP